MIEWPLQWRTVVDEAIARRKKERLTQRELSALAGVSLPTIVAFEKGAIRLNFERVVAILQTLGMFEAPEAGDSLHSFVAAARRRWEALVASLPPDHPSRQPRGHSEQAYELDGASTRSIGVLRDLLRDAPRATGWPPFWVAEREALRPTIRDGILECWLGKPDTDRVFNDPAHSDFWRLSRNGSAYLQRGYQEDGPDLEPGTIFDLTLPVWRTAELLLHAVWLARSIEVRPRARIRILLRYTGLEGRELFSWAKPRLGVVLDRTYRCRSTAADLSAQTTLEHLAHDLEPIMMQLLKPLYERFDGFQLPSELVRSQLAEVQRNFADPRKPW